MCRATCFRPRGPTLLKTGLALAFASVALLQPARAQIATDGSLGAATRLTGPNYQISPILGTFRGPNLFHSFSEFSLLQGERATFQGANNTRFIIARITGGSPSSINGQLAVAPLSGAPLNASVFLINPAGIAFGPNASLNINGSFHASTGSGLRLSDGSVFSADPRQQGELGAGTPSSFLFSGPSGALSADRTFLRVPELGTIGLHAGSLLLNQAILTAPSGQISLSAFQGNGEVRLDGMRLAGQTQGDIRILNGSLIAVSEGAQGLGGGRLVIRGGQVYVEQSTLESRSRRGNGADITIEGSTGIDMRGSRVLAITTGAGSASDVLISGRNVTLDNTAISGECDAGCQATARGANIRIEAEQNLELRNGSTVKSLTRAAGRAGSISAAARDINILAGSGMDTSCDPGCGTGSAGALTLTVSGGLNLTGSDAAAAFLVANSFGAGNAGRVELRAGSINLTGNAVVESITLQSGSSPGILLDADFIRILGGAQAVTSTSGASPGGPISAVARQGLMISGTRQNTSSGKIFASGLASSALGSGDAGNITIATPTLQVLGGGEISSSVLAGSTGKGGDITIQARDAVIVDGADASDKRSSILSNTFSSGSAGRIQITTRNVSLSNKGILQSQTEASGSGGVVRIEAENLSIQNGGQILTATSAQGAGGQLLVSLTQDLIIRNDADRAVTPTGIFSNSRNAGSGGNIELSAHNIELTRQALINASSDRAGNGGTVRLTATGNVSIAEQSSLRAFSSGTGLAGNIQLGVGGNLSLADSLITTSARQSDGGNIGIQVAGNATLTLSRIAAEVGTGQGNGGNLVFAARSLLMRGAAISANAFGGAGGNIRIGSPYLINDAVSSITASSALGIDGTVQLDSPAIDLAALLAAARTQFLDATLVGAGSCLRRNDGVESRLALVAPRDDAVRRLGPSLADYALPLPPLSLPDAACLPAPSPPGTLPHSTAGPGR